MDPASAMGLAAQIGTIIKQLYDYAKAVKSAQSDIQKMLTELLALEAILRGLDERNTKERLAANGLDHVLPDFLKVLVAFEKGLTTESSKWKTAMQSLKWPFKQNENEAFLTSVERVKTTFILFTMGETQAAVLQLRNFDATEITTRLRNADQDRELQAAEKRLQGLREFVAPVSTQATHKTACTVWQSSPSGAWLLEDPLPTWLGDQGTLKRVLHISGKSGAGKTTVMARIFEHLKHEWQDVAAASFYCAYNDAATQEANNICGSWVAQLSVHDEKVLDEFEQYLDDEATVTPFSLYVEAIGRLADSGKHVVLMLDAVNELRDPSLIVERIAKLVQRSKRIRFILSSTAHSKALFPSLDCLQIDMSADAVAQDIAAFVRQQIRTHDTLKRVPEDQILHAVLTRADGMFRWASCLMNILVDQLIPNDVHAALNTLPRTLEGAYVATLERVPVEIRKYVRRALLWLSFSLRPLKLVELAEAVILKPQLRKIDDNDRILPAHRIVSLCEGLVTWDAATDRVSLAHASIQTFLTSDTLHDSSMKFFWLEPGPAIASIVQDCLRYLLMDPFSVGVSTQKECLDLIDQYPLLLYAGNFWPLHLRRLNAKRQTHLCPDVWDLFRSRKNDGTGNFFFWVRVLLVHSKSMGNIIRQAEPLYYSASFGLNVVVEYLHAQGHIQTTDPSAPGYLEHKCGRGRSTALQVAATRGHEKVVQLLLQWGADPNSTGRNGMTCLDWAGGQVEIARLLRDAGGKHSEDPKRQYRY